MPVVRSQDSDLGIQLLSSQDGDGHSIPPADPSASQVCEWGNGEKNGVLFSSFPLSYPGDKLLAPI